VNTDEWNHQNQINGLQRRLNDQNLWLAKLQNQLDAITQNSSPTITETSGESKTADTTPPNSSSTGAKDEPNDRGEELKWTRGTLLDSSTEITLTLSTSQKEISVHRSFTTMHNLVNNADIVQRNLVKVVLEGVLHTMANMWFLSGRAKNAEEW
jgi:uncharacterized coiled-coil protein SlyX